MDKEQINNRFIEAIDFVLQSNVGLSKKDVATSLMVKPSKFSEILNKRMGIGVDIAALLCANYGVSSDWLLMGKGDIMSNNPHSIVVEKANGDSFLIDKIASQAEEIGRLKEQVRQLEDNIKKLVSDAACSSIADAG